MEGGIQNGIKQLKLGMGPVDIANLIGSRESFVDLMTTSK